MNVKLTLVQLYLAQGYYYLYISCFLVNHHIDSSLMILVTLFLFYKNIFYKNIEAEICEILRIF